MIAVESVSKRFGDFTALDDISFEAPDGKLTALLGPSGSGKSTLLRVIAGLEVPDSGTIVVSGTDATWLPPQKRGIGFVFQHYAAFKHMTLRDNVAFGLKIRKKPKADIKAKVDELLHLVGLDGFHDRYPAQLSGGQRQRMALARALAVEPSVLLLDEPFGALDANVRADLRAWLRRMHEQVPVTTVLVTHDQEEAMELADRIVLLKDGKIAQVGAPRELYDQPADAFVMGFLGRGLEARRRARAPARRRALRPAGGRLGGGDGPARRAPRLRGPRRGRARRRRGGLGAAHARGGRGARARTPARSSGCARRPAAGQRLIHASGSSPRRRISGGSSPAASSASVTCSTTARTLARTAIQISCRSLAGPGYSTSSGASPRTLASGPSTARMTSASVISSAGWASQ